MNYVTVYKDGVYFGAFENTGKHRKSDAVSAFVASRASPASWAELHQFIPCGDSTDALWLNDFTLRVLTGPCQCRNHWMTYLADNPPDFSSPEAWFSWSVSAHNAVNQRLGKRIYTLKEARALWFIGKV